MSDDKMGAHTMKCDNIGAITGIANAKIWLIVEEIIEVVKVMYGIREEKRENVQYSSININVY